MGVLRKNVLGEFPNKKWLGSENARGAFLHIGFFVVKPIFAIIFWPNKSTTYEALLCAYSVQAISEP